MCSLSRKIPRLVLRGTKESLSLRFWDFFFQFRFLPPRRPLSCLPPSPLAIDEASAGFDSFCIRATARLNFFQVAPPPLSPHTIAIAPSIFLALLVCEVVRLLNLLCLKCVNFAAPPTCQKDASQNSDDDRRREKVRHGDIAEMPWEEIG